ncbi:unnamed protein product [Acanthoscelides obtectus]|uniref:Uncharacterized protein n=1 Tax=Acanthoscelides obtectus TaxID=200917 RepID=A0A9P0VRC7_ACAOB|nr:unnamed protein product [Acanthoscelides obtectus]CAK1656865.1 hypothetical protein AOBTE_LOCUS19976 [Acanthoscelides obtectus]
MAKMTILAAAAVLMLMDCVSCQTLLPEDEESETGTLDKVRVQKSRYHVAMQLEFLTKSTPKPFQIYGHIF